MSLPARAGGRMSMGRREMAEPAPCGLRTPHGPHSFGDDELCPGIAAAPPYKARHKGVYQTEEGGSWLRLLRSLGKHRSAAGDPDLAGPPEPRPRPRLGWDCGHSDKIADDTNDDKDSDDE